VVEFVIGGLESAADLDLGRALLREYYEGLPHSPCFPGFDEELSGLPGAYGSPGGDFLIARCLDGVGAGCVVLRSMPFAGAAEMKRLFVRSEFRGLGLGRRLVEAAIESARCLRYSELRLDTIDFMKSARRIYAELGFIEVEPWVETKACGVIFMSLRLS
jgi:GNAT superfamily N-acetyltransferase